ncbi:ATP-dependent DNA helicase PIF1 [Apostasia shenzhenica]|uniref:ATP-dependent DNA helicase n=1 Tax=Apostasia shenzhenica TaxID=1088818 RepID=A0A2I0AM88_9ASPA|nr:ATP-dependent DNA helicase PIF1 [Apostasia shenzhenica]
MSLVQRYGKPDIFLTITCNPAWSEIVSELGINEIVQNRPDLTCRIFRAKLIELKDLIIKKNFFGPVAAFAYVVEFQKGGLPHAHFLIILKESSKITSAESYDEYVAAEIPDAKKHPLLFELVLKHMMHGPCGEKNPKNVCMNKKGYCKSRYPKPYCEYTIQAEDSYPMYRRRNNKIQVKVRKAILDNRWVVPYNPYLLCRFDCHLNVEICSSISSVKYLYKYIYKDHDKIAFNLVDTEKAELFVDEIEQFQTGRWISPPEAMWRIYAFILNEIHPSVTTLQIHLPHKHAITFQESQDLQKILSFDFYKRTMLTEFFTLNAMDNETKKILYKQLPEYYTWDRQGKFWSKRKKQKVIGRIALANPVEGERYYLRLLLNHVKGPTSFTDLQTYQNIQYKSFQDAAIARGLLDSDNNINECLAEAAILKMSNAFRRLFATLLVFCTPGNPIALLNKYYNELTDDFRRDTNDPNKTLQVILNSIDSFLQGMGKQIIDYISMPTYVEQELSIQVSEEELKLVSLLNSDQRTIYDTIIKSINCEGMTAFFIDGPGGTGKSFLYRALLATIRNQKQIALATATSGVAASILPGGRTAHSRFKIPINMKEATTCNISKQSTTADLLRRAKLIIWDEATMARKCYIEALDKTLQDIMESEIIFGGKTIVLGGDFRQILPVIQGESEDVSINNSIVMSFLWPHLTKLHLTRNMRAINDPDFSEYLLRIGNGEENTIKQNWITIPKKMLVPYNQTEEASIKDLIFEIYSDTSYSNEYYFVDVAILTAKNEYVEKINNMIIDQFPGQQFDYYSFDSLVGSQENMLINTDFLNDLSPATLLPHKLTLKENCPVMLLRNLDPSSGLSNGSRLICKKFSKNVIDAEIVTGNFKGTRILLPRIPLQSPEESKIPFQFTRK